MCVIGPGLGCISPPRSSSVCRSRMYAVSLCKVVCL